MSWRDIFDIVGILISGGMMPTDSADTKFPKNPGYQLAVFGGGCFWCTEAVFQRLKGVKSITSGYAGGTSTNPTYEEVCSGETGHAEVVSIEFDPAEISYVQLLDVFFHTHNPTTPDQQGNDRGSQYRSIILTTSDEQAAQAKEAVRTVNETKVFKNPVVTEVKPLEGFYPAEVSHQEYYARNPQAAYCQIVINPKLEKFEKLYGDLLK